MQVIEQFDGTEPIEPEKPYSEMTYEEQLAFSQNMRHGIFKAVSKTPTGQLPTDKESVDIMLRTLKEMDGTTLANRRNQIDTQANKTSAEIVEGMAAFIRMQKNTNPFAVAPEEQPVDLSKRFADDTKIDLGEHEHAKGEEVVGIIAETSEEFNIRMAQHMERLGAEED